MRFDELEHLIRAAGAIIGEDAIIVAGSQSALASLGDRGDLPQELVMSIEADLLPLDDPDERKSDLIDGSIGEGSLFQEAFGIYGHGVSASGLRLPAGWRERLVPLRSPNTGGVTGHCLDLHDLFIAKLLANRDKDREFCDALLRCGVIRTEVVAQRLDQTDCRPDERRRIMRRVGVEPPPEGTRAQGEGDG